MRTPLAAFADWNLTATEVEAIADMIGATFVRGRGVDNGFIRGADLIKVQRIGKHGSDHEALVIDLVLYGGERVRILWWNVYVGQQPAAVLTTLCGLVDLYQPHLVGLCEAYRCRTVLAQVPGYRRFQGLDVGERADVAVLVRRDLKIIRRGVLEMAMSWIGPKHNREKAPRSYRRLMVEFKSGARLRVLFAHLPTGGYNGRNGKPVTESRDRIVRWADVR